MAIDPGKTAGTDRLIAEAVRSRQLREDGYRERALKIYPWICGRCGREFARHNLRELTVHHRDHNHDNNPADGSNWELLCIYCHDNEHAREIDTGIARRMGVELACEAARPRAATQPFAGLRELLQRQANREKPEE